MVQKRFVDSLSTLLKNVAQPLHLELLCLTGKTGGWSWQIPITKMSLSEINTQCPVARDCIMPDKVFRLSNITSPGRFFARNTKQVIVSFWRKFHRNPLSLFSLTLHSLVCQWNSMKQPIRLVCLYSAIIFHKSPCFIRKSSELT